MKDGLKDFRNIIEEEGNEKDFEYKGYECLILRHSSLSHLCGYVEIPMEHPLYEKNYSDCLSLDQEKRKELIGNVRMNSANSILTFLKEINGMENSSMCSLFDCHGGITFSGRFNDKKGWFIGFDCAHYGDRSSYSYEGVYRDMKYVEEECKRLVDQIIEITPFLRIKTSIEILAEQAVQ